MFTIVLKFRGKFRQIFPICPKKPVEIVLKCPKNNKILFKILAHSYQMFDFMFIKFQLYLATFTRLTILNVHRPIYISMITYEFMPKNKGREERLQPSRFQGVRDRGF